MDTDVDNIETNVEPAAVAEVEGQGTLVDPSASIVINSVDDIKHVILTSKLTLTLANRIFNSPLKDEFIVTYFILLSTLELHSTAKVSFLTCVIQNSQYELARTLLDTHKFTFVEILKCLKVLDSKRALKVYKKKLESMVSKYTERKDRLTKASDEYLAKKALDDAEKKKPKNDSKKDSKTESKEDSNNINDDENNNNNNVNSVRGRGARGGRGGRGARGGRPSAPVMAVTEDAPELDKKMNKKVREMQFEQRYQSSKRFMESKITELEQYQCKGSLCGSVTKLFKRWFQTVPVKTLEFFALGQPKETWREIANLLHLAPSDFKLPWFLEFMFGKPAPESTSVRAFDDAKALLEAGRPVVYGNLISIFKPPYSFLRKRLGDLFTDSLKVKVATYEDLSTVLWWYHEFKDVHGIDDMIVRRLAAREPLTLAYGTLIEKTLSLTNSAEHSRVFNALLKASMQRLSTFSNRFSLPPPIATFGDRSGSMEVAIRLSTIIGYLVTNLTPNSTLSFFNTETMNAPITPSSIEKLFKLTDVVTADGGTANAVALKPFLDSKTPLKYIVMVTDEEENEDVDGMRFAEMFSRYKKEVAPDCKVIFISFLQPNQRGHMVSDLEDNYNIEPIQFVLDGGKPDVTKIDHMLTSLACESPMFTSQLELLCKVMSLFGTEFFVKYLNANSSKLLTYGLNSEIEVMILKHLLQFYMKKLPKDKDNTLSHFSGRVFNEDNCIKMISAHLKSLVDVSKQAGLDTLVSFVEDAVKTFNSLERKKSVEFLSSVFETLDQDYFIKKVDLPSHTGDDHDKIDANNLATDPMAFKDRLCQGELSIPEIVTLLNNKNTKDKFISVYLMLLNNIELTSKVKMNTLCAALECKMTSFAQLILYNKKYSFKEVSKAIQILDSKRQISQLEKKMLSAQKKHDDRKARLEKESNDYHEKIKADPNNNNATTTTTTKTTTSAKAKPTGKFKGKGKGKSPGKGPGKGKGPTKGKGKGKEDNAAKVVGDEVKSEPETEPAPKDKKLSPWEKKQREQKFENNFEASIKLLQSRIDQLKKYQFNGSLSGNVIKIFKRWLKTFPEKTLEYFALGQPKEIWKEMANLLHLSPKDMQADWFLPSVYNSPHTGEVINAFAPEELPMDTLLELIAKYKPSYSYVRKRIPKDLFTDELRLIVAGYEELTTVLWWYHELASFDVDSLVARRLANNELGQMSLGTLLEKAMYFQHQGIPLFNDIMPIIRNALKVFSSKIALPPPLMTLGDASASMDVAIRLSTIISSLVTSLTDNASLRFFNHAPLWAPIDPTSLTEVFNVSNIIQGSGSTSPAAGLYPVFEANQELQYLVLVTDEEENSLYKGYNFLTLYKEYVAKVAPNCKLVFVSFLQTNEEGQMMQEFEQEGIKPLQFKLDKTRPDATKIDDLITTLSCQSDSFLHQVTAFETMINLCGEKYFYKYVGKGEGYFVESFTFQTLMHMLSMVSLYVSGQMEEEQEGEDTGLQAALDLAISTRQFKVVTQDILDKIKRFAKKCGYSTLHDAILDIDTTVINAPLNDYQMIESFVTKVDILSKNPELFAKEKVESPAPNLLLKPPVDADMSKVRAREYGELNEYDINMLFGYLDEIGSLKSCSGVSKLWRQCSLNPKHWTRFMNARDIRQLDLVFLVDDTGSMGSEINQVKTTINEIVDEIVSLGSIEVRVGMVFYNDHTGGSKDSVAKVFDFTTDIPELRNKLSAVQVNGGNDFPEALADGMAAVGELSFARSSTKVCILIGDAPPHGFCTKQEDYFPEGCPCGKDVISSTRDLVSRGVTFYSVVCRFENTTYQVFSAISDMSEGRCVTLQDATQLKDIITGSAKESILLDMVANEVLKECEYWRQKVTSCTREEAIYRASYSLRAKGVRVPQLRALAKNQQPKDHIYRSILKSKNHTEYKVNVIKAKNSIPTKEPKIGKAASVTTVDSDSSKLEECLISIDNVRKIAKKHHFL
ncbi:hypothetical protein SAMD00019534_013090 [Acytostelium subglobosum LB1]|uniref:hypothetical protein n=1 Tax=Acytostelium subglobosum LB1 TaxID=1410327 RepID=UPI000644E612|nr:hypothetical protein SAMD00019534_013090 [Acytostelium subglobosum LB1]GAM18134.1 hypothetical protein SAMD00019534_013090 [Acytostelium subglobosum LB1]|eukprot:XP_012758730.1 hypothetical protein SAMD00019534_013090 [Acytostelium subglobosum LB1]